MKSKASDKRHFPGFLTTLVLLFAAISAQSATVTPLQYLQSQTRPAFRAGHTLYPLSIFGSGSAVRNFNTYVELANWGYALEFTNSWSVFSGDSNSCKSTLTNPSSYEYKIIQLAKTNPAKYKLLMPAMQYRWQGMVPLTTTECPDCYAHGSNGSVLMDNNMPIINPIMSDASLARCGAAYAWPFEYVQRQFGVKITMGMHQGEAACWDCWDNDPNVVADRGTKNHEQYRDQKFDRIIKGFFGPVQNALSSDGLFFYYSNAGHWDRNRYGGWVGGVPAYFEYTKEATLLPSNEHYWYSFNVGVQCDIYDGSQTYNFLTKYFASTGYEIEQGKPYSYEWTSPGWSNYTTSDSQYNAPADIWTGAMKCLYTGGMLGANIGMYGYETNYPASFDEAKPPLFIQQWMVNSRAHALFSWIEPFVRNSDLLPGPYTHLYAGTPAYEFIKQTQTNGQPISGCGARVMARKHSTSNRWLICAWNHNGSDRNVTVTIPTLGSVTVMARKTGTLYHAKLNGSTPVLTMLDSDGMAVTVDTTTIKTQISDLYPMGVIHRYQQLQHSFLSNLQYDVIDPSGKIIARSAGPEKLHLRSGVYFLKQKDQGMLKVQKIMLMK